MWLHPVAVLSGVLEASGDNTDTIQRTLHPPCEQPQPHPNTDACKLGSRAVSGPGPPTQFQLQSLVAAFKFKVISARPGLNFPLFLVFHTRGPLFCLSFKKSALGTMGFCSQSAKKPTVGDDFVCSMKETQGARLTPG